MDTSPYEYKKTNLQLIAEGDESAFYEFYQHHSSLLREFLKHNAGKTGAGEDIIQETFIRVWLYRDKLPEVENPSGWVYRIASRVYADHLRREIKNRQRQAGSVYTLYVADKADSAERTQLEELTIHIRSAIDKLPEHKKKLYWLSREQHMKPAAIAARLGMPVGTVKNQLSATIREIRENMNAAGFSVL